MCLSDLRPLPLSAPLQDFYGAYDAQEFATANAPELGMQTVPSLNITYTEEQVGHGGACCWGEARPGQARSCAHGLGPDGLNASVEAAHWVVPGCSGCLLKSCFLHSHQVACSTAAHTVPACPSPCGFQGYVTADVAEREGLHKLNLSGTKFRKMLRAGGRLLGFRDAWDTAF
jgi:hypothetical protein